MQFEDNALSRLTIEGDSTRMIESGANMDRAYPRLKSPAAIAARQRNLAPEPAGVEIPAAAEPAPLAGLLTPLEGVEPDTQERNEQRADDDGHDKILPAKPTKERRKKPRRTKQVYQRTDKPRGPVPFEPTEKQRQLVAVLVGTSTPLKTIAGLIGEGISLPTLRTYFQHEIDNGRENFVASLKTMIVRSAQGGSVRAQTYLLDRLGGPDFQPKMRLGGMEDAPPIQISSDARVTIFLPDNGRRSSNQE